MWTALSGQMFAGILATEIKVGEVPSNTTTVVFDGTSPTFISQTLRDGTPQVQTSH